MGFGSELIECFARMIDLCLNLRTPSSHPSATLNAEGMGGEVVATFEEKDSLLSDDPLKKLEYQPPTCV